MTGSLDWRHVRVALVVSRFNEIVTERLLAGAERYLDQHGCSPDRRLVLWVPGAWEIPLAVESILAGEAFAAVVALGAVVRGETPHFDFICAAVAQNLARLGVEHQIPIGFGVLTANTIDQALARAGGDAGNKGWEAAAAALEMVRLLRGLG